MTARPLALPFSPRGKRGRPLTFLALGLLAACGPSFPEVERPVDWASPLFGSGGFGYAAGSAYPGAMAPDLVIEYVPEPTVLGLVALGAVAALRRRRAQ